MPNTIANGIRLEYETFGSPDAEPLLLVMGLGAQMIAWERGFCEELAARGHYVIRFDNRDVGLSEHLDDAGVPEMEALFGAFQAGRQPDAPYSLDDMADDACGLLDALGLDAAHVCGASMGGMIAQALAIRHPSRVLSLISIMSSSGRPGLPGPTPEAAAVLLAAVPGSREAAIAAAVEGARVLAGGGFPFDEDLTRRRATEAYDRAHYPQGIARQMAAIVAHGSRVEALGRLSLPAIVIHGTADPLVPVEAGKDTAACIPGAELVLIEGMGHELPRGAWPQVIDAICRATGRGSKAG